MSDEAKARRAKARERRAPPILADDLRPEPDGGEMASDAVEFERFPAPPEASPPERSVPRDAGRAGPGGGG